MKGEAVNRVDDCRCPGSSGGMSPQDARFGRMGVHHVRFAFADQFDQFAVTSEISSRVDLTNQVGGFDGVDATMGLNIRKQRAFRSMDGAVDKIHVVSIVGLAHAGEHGVLLAAAKNQPGRDVHDSHAIRLSAVGGQFARAIVDPLEAQALGRKSGAGKPAFAGLHRFPYLVGDEVASPDFHECSGDDSHHVVEEAVAGHFKFYAV